MSMDFNSNQYKLIHKILGGIQAPVFNANRNHRILYQNKAAAELFNSKLGGFCWLDLWKGEAHLEEQKRLFNEGKILSNMQCYFCSSNEALKTINDMTKEYIYQINIGKFIGC